MNIGNLKNMKGSLMSILILIISLMSGYSASLYYLAFNNEIGSNIIGETNQAQMLAESALEYAAYTWSKEYRSKNNKLIIDTNIKNVGNIGQYKISGVYQTDLLGKELPSNRLRFETLGIAGNSTAKLSGTIEILPADRKFNKVYATPVQPWWIETREKKSDKTRILYGGYDLNGGIDSTGALTTETSTTPTIRRTTVATQYLEKPIRYSEDTILNFNYYYKTKAPSKGYVKLNIVDNINVNDSTGKIFTQEQVPDQANVYTERRLTIKIPAGTLIYGFQIQFDVQNSRQEPKMWIPKMWIDDINISGPGLARISNYRRNF